MCSEAEVSCATGDSRSGVTTGDSCSGVTTGDSHSGATVCSDAEVSCATGDSQWLVRIEEKIAPFKNKPCI